ncbi:hypothetical protein FRC10_002102, partial [Ceratobasidium sp. 414]
MLSANAANITGSNALYSNPLFSTLFPNHPGLGGDGTNLNHSNSASTHPGESKSGGSGDIWPTLARGDSGTAAVSASTGGSSGGGAGDTSWLSFLGNPRDSQPPSDDVDLSSLFPFDTSGTGVGGTASGPTDDGEDDQDER